jgi:hypothetical protein
VAAAPAGGRRRPDREAALAALRQRIAELPEEAVVLAEDESHLRVLHGARDSPHDNPTERIWGALKTHLANSPTLTIQGRIRQVHAFFRARTLNSSWPRRPVQLAAAARGYMQNHRQVA